MIAYSFEGDMEGGFILRLQPVPARSKPNPPISISRPRMTRVRLRAAAALKPYLPRVYTWLASSAPNPPGSGMTSETQPIIQPAVIFQNGRGMLRKVVIRA